MDIKFDEYLAKGTEKILEIFSSTDISDEEKEVIVSSFSEKLMKNIGDTSKLQDYEYEIYSVSLKFLDEMISGTISNVQASYSEYENAIKYCARIKDILQIFSLKKWNIPKLGNSDIDKCEQILRTRQESTSISSKIIDEDHKIDEQLKIAQHELSVNACDTVLALLEELANDLAVCKQKKVSVPTVNNKDTKKIAKKITEIRKVAEQKESLHQTMCDVDFQIHNIISMSKSSPEQWQEVITLCQKQVALISDCSKKQWPMPSLRCANTNELITKYKHYSHMNVLDKSISSNRALLTSGKQYKTFFGNCTQLANCIDTCEQNNWPLPDLIITDPLGLSAEVREEKKRKDRVKKIKQKKKERNFSAVIILIITLFSVIALSLILMLSGILSGNQNNYIEVPEVKNLTLAQAKDTLDNLGLNIVYPLTYETTDDVEASRVVSIYPDSGSQVEKGSKVRLTISNGKFELMEDYSGKNYDAVFNELFDTNLKVSATYITNSDLTPGTIVDQSIKAGTKFDPYIKNEIIFTVVDAETMNVPIHLLGKNVYNMQIELSEQGFNVELREVDYDDLSSSQKEKYKEYEIINVDPGEGAQYIKKPDSKLILDYYVNSKED